MVDIVQSNKFFFASTSFFAYALPTTPPPTSFHFISFLCINSQIYQAVKYLGFNCVRFSNSHIFWPDKRDSLKLLHGFKRVTQSPFCLALA